MDKELKKSAIQLAYASSVGIAMVLAIFGCLLIGVYLDRKFDTGSVFTFIFLLIGIVTGKQEMKEVFLRLLTIF